MRFGVWRPLLGLIQGAPGHAAGADWRAEWSLRRAGVLSARGMRSVYLALFSVLLILAGCLWYADVSQALPSPLPRLLPFAAAAWALMALALLFHVRHAADRDLIAMKPSLVRVEQHRAGQVRRTDFNPRWVRVEPDLHDGSLIRLSGQGRSVAVGEYVSRASRSQLAEEFRWALRHLDD
jgi:uncharacterized membrane protein